MCVFVPFTIGYIHVFMYLHCRHHLVIVHRIQFLHLTPAYFTLIWIIYFALTHDFIIMKVMFRAWKRFKALSCGNDSFDAAGETE